MFIFYLCLPHMHVYAYLHVCVCVCVCVCVYVYDATSGVKWHTHILCMEDKKAFCSHCLQ